MGRASWRARVEVLQVAASWKWASALRVKGVEGVRVAVWLRWVRVAGLEPVQVPFWQLSVWVQALPSLHAVAVLAFGLGDVPVVLSCVLPMWHWSSALQVTGLEPVQVPFWQLSVWVQALPSLHAVP